MLASVVFKFKSVGSVIGYNELGQWKICKNSGNPVIINREICYFFQTRRISACSHTLEKLYEVSYN
jgi:hypothetical protein